jgi:general secretion pathway protein D
MAMSFRKNTVPLIALCVALLMTGSPVRAQQAQQPRQAQQPSSSAGVIFNFSDVDITAVAKFVSDITGKNFIYDDRVRGKITIIAPTKISIKDAFSLFTSVLQLKGFTLVPSGVDAYKIVPIAEARQEGIEIAAARPPINDNFIARLIPLEHISSDEALKFLQPVISRNGHISSFGPGNILFVVDTGLNIEKVLGIVKIIDQPSVSEEPEVVYLKYASADDVVKILNEGLGKAEKTIKGYKSVADSRLNAVVLFGDKSTKDGMRRLIAMLDVTSEEMHGAINVYFLENANAEDLAKVLQGLISPQSAAARGPRAPVPGPTPFEAATNISITPDKATNSLIIIASPSDYKNLVSVIQQLDRKRRQVFVEAMIVEARINKLRDLGASWRAVARANGEPVFIGGVGTIDTTAVQSIISGLAGLTAGGMGNFFTVPVVDFQTGEQRDLTIPGFAALFNLREFRDAVDVLSTPQILTSDNAEAEIMVGENVPFISKIERGLTTGDQVPFSSIERQDVGITLRITPHITEGEFVNLDIYQEISAVQSTPEQVFITVGPSTTKRSTKTTVTVKDGQTVVIGGLMQEKKEETVNKVPLLGDIPILGWLFKSKNVTDDKTNLLVFLTPHVIRDAAELRELSHQKKVEFARQGSKYVEEELLVKFKPDVTEETALAIISKEGASVIKYLEEPGVYQIKLKKGQEVEDAARRFASLPEVEYAEPNYTIRLK